MAVGAITVNVQANTAKATKNLDKFGKGAKRSGKAAKSAKSGVTGLSGSLVKLAGAAAAAMAIKFATQKFFAIADGLDRVAKASKNLGMIPGKLMALEHAATLSGRATATLTKGLKMQVRVISEAAQGMGPAVKAIEELGLSAVELNKLSPSDQFKAIADALQRFPPQEKVRLTALLFGGKGQEFIEMLNLGSRGIRNIERDVKRMGGSFSEEDLAKVEAFNDAMARLSLLTTTYGQQIVIAMAPSLVAGIEALAETIEGFRLVFGGWQRFKTENAWVGNVSSAVSTGKKYNPWGLAQRGIGAGTTYMANKGQQGGSLTSVEEAERAKRMLRALDGANDLTREQNETLSRSREIVRLGSLP